MLKEISKDTHMQTIRGFYTHYDEDPEGQWGYLALINQLRTLFREKDRQRAARVLRPHNLGGRTPSQFLAILSAEMSGITMDMLAKEILANVLPPTSRPSSRQTRTLRSRWLRQPTPSTHHQAKSSSGQPPKQCARQQPTPSVLPRTT